MYRVQIIYVCSLYFDNEKLHWAPTQYEINATTVRCAFSFFSSNILLIKASFIMMIIIYDIICVFFQLHSDAMISLKLQF